MVNISLSEHQEQPIGRLCCACIEATCRGMPYMSTEAVVETALREVPFREHCLSLKHMNGGELAAHISGHDAVEQEVRHEDQVSMVLDGWTREAFSQAAMA